MLGNSRQRLVAFSAVSATSAAIAAASFFPRHVQSDSAADTLQGAIISTDGSPNRDLSHDSAYSDSIRSPISISQVESMGTDLAEPVGETLQESWRESSEQYENGNIKARGLLKDGKREGTWYHFREDGSISQIGSYLDGQAIGPWELYDEQGKLSLEYEQKGEQFSYRRFNPLTGNLAIEETRVIRKDHNGDEHDDRVGRCVEYYPDGQRRCEGSYSDGKESGLWYAWHENGKLKFQGVFSQGERSGEWVYWRDDGSVDSENSGYYEGDLKR